MCCNVWLFTLPHHDICSFSTRLSDNAVDSGTYVKIMSQVACRYEHSIAVCLSNAVCLRLFQHLWDFEHEEIACGHRWWCATPRINSVVGYVLDFPFLLMKWVAEKKIFKRMKRHIEFLSFHWVWNLRLGFYLTFLAQFFDLTTMITYFLELPGLKWLLRKIYICWGRFLAGPWCLIKLLA